MAESSSPREDLKTLSPDTDRSDQTYKYSGSGRSYECVFCERGFSTAQALGGHMNIHRKHRAPKPSPNFSAGDRLADPLISSSLADHRERFRPFLAIQSYPPAHLGNDHQVHVNYQTHTNNSISTRVSTTTTASRNFNCSRYDLNDLSRENWRRGCWSLGIGTTRHVEEEDEDEDDDINQKSIGDLSEDHSEVDLELRLGYDP